ncbi:MAG: M16 family metallopeptidase [Flavobacteriales bacterium]
MKVLKSTSFIGGILLVNALTAQNIRFEEYTLKNGLHVILHEDHSTPITAVTVMYHVGSKNETVGRSGMAHFFEHLLFEGSENIGRGQYSKYVENAGGGLNANTSQDRTFYYELLPSNQLELGLWLESERMLHAKVEMVGIETQREVVKEEKRQRVDNQPYGTLFQETLDHAFDVHPYSWPPIGSMEDLNAAKEDDFKNFYKKFYVPNNAVLSIAGDIDMAVTKQLIEKYFASIPRGLNEVPRPTQVEPINKGEVRDTVWVKDQLPMVVQAYHIPAQGTPEYYAIDMLNQLLSQGESSRLNKSLVDEKQVALYSGAFTYNTEHPGLTLAYSLANMGVDAVKVEEAMNAEFDRVKNEMISDQELQKLRNQVENDFVSRNGSVAGIAESLANYHMYFGDANLINTEIEKYNAITKQDMLNAAKKYYTSDNRVVLYFLNDPKLSEN